MPLREKKDSAEYYEAVLSLKSTGLTYLTQETIYSLLCSVCERDIVESALEKKSRSSHSRTLSHSFRFLSPPPLCDSFRTTTRDDTSARCGFSRVYSHVFACVWLSVLLLNRFFFFSSSSQKKRFFIRARERQTLFIFWIRRREEVKEEDKAHQKWCSPLRTARL